MDNDQAANERLATKRMRIDVNRILLGWDPLCVKGLRGGEREYEPFAGPLVVMVKKNEDPMAIARRLEEIATQEWRVPVTFEKCYTIAKKIYNVGALYRGEDPQHTI